MDSLNPHQTRHIWRGPGDNSSFSEELRAAAAVSAWEEVLSIFGRNNSIPAHGRVKVVALGDTHGANPDEICQDLHRVGMLDSSFNWSETGGRVLVQVGDIVDRGRYGLENYQLFSRLQTQAQGAVIRELGNHCLFHLAGMPEMIRAPRIPGLQRSFIEDVLNDRIVAAWYEGDTIYVHAGIDLDFLPEYRGVPNQEIVTSLNHRLKAAVTHFADELLSDPSDPVSVANRFFDFDRIFDSTRGIFWTRGDIANEQFRQVVGHTPQLDGIVAVARLAE